MLTVAGSILRRAALLSEKFLIDITILYISIIWTVMVIDFYILLFTLINNMKYSTLLHISLISFFTIILNE